MFAFPEELKERIEKLAEHHALASLAVHSRLLTERYRQGDSARFVQGEKGRLAYLLARMPATFAALSHVLAEASSRAPSLRPASLLDLGAGPGTGMWAARQHFSSINKVTLFERDRELIALGKQLSRELGIWIEDDLETEEAFEPHDLVLISYALGELNTRLKVARRAWQAAKQLLVIVEPGTPEGFAKLRAVREALITEGAHLIAPCPHALTCPMQAGDWCHFSERLARSALHRKIKGGALGYEDEKFSYLIFSKENLAERVRGRVLRHPVKRPGCVELEVCTHSHGLVQKKITRKDKEKFRLARKIAWGDSYFL